MFEINWVLVLESVVLSLVFKTERLLSFPKICKIMQKFMQIMPKTKVSSENKSDLFVDIEVT